MRAYYKDPGPGAADALKRVLGDAGLSSRRRRIRCPLCRWEPGPHDRWACRCGTVWNTFDTRGLCPGCQYQWTETACLKCGRWSPHERWYEPRE